MGFGVPNRVKGTYIRYNLFLRTQNEPLNEPWKFSVKRLSSHSVKTAENHIFCSRAHIWGCRPNLKPHSSKPSSRGNFFGDQSLKTNFHYSQKAISNKKTLCCTPERIFVNFFCSNPSLDQKSKSQPKKHNIAFAIFWLACNIMVGGGALGAPLSLLELSHDIDSNPKKVLGFWKYLPSLISQEVLLLTVYIEKH